MVFHAFSFVFSQFPLALETKSISVTSPRKIIIKIQLIENK